MGVSLAACAPKLEVQVYLGDIEEAFETGKAFDIPVRLSIPQSSEDTCKSEAAELTASLSRVVENAKFAGCEREEFNSFAIFDATLPLYATQSDTSPDVNWNGVPLIVHAAYGQLRCLENPRKFCDAVTIYLAPNGTFADLVTKYQGNEPYYGPKPDPIELSVVLENDTRDPIKASGENVFINGQPVAFGYAEEFAVALERRQSVRIELSDVANAGFSSAQVVIAAGIYLQSTATPAKPY